MYINGVGKTLDKHGYCAALHQIPELYRKKSVASKQTVAVGTVYQLGVSPLVTERVRMCMGDCVYTLSTCFLSGPGNQGQNCGQSLCRSLGGAAT